MSTYFKLMHTMTARLIRVVAGLFIVIEGAQLSAGYAFVLAIVGTAIAVTGIADICPMELAFGSRPAAGSNPHSRGV